MLEICTFESLKSDKMDKTRFDEFVNKKSNSEKQTINWDEKLKRWKTFIDTLYQNINGWLKEYVDSGKIKIRTREIEIFEEALGNYKVQSMEITIGSDMVTLKPIGTILIGTIGRVDLIGKSNVQKLVLADKKATNPQIKTCISFDEKEPKANVAKMKEAANTPVDWVWKITSNPPRIKYSELNQESFFDCLMNVING